MENECFICCTKDGKVAYEKLFKTSLDYPLITLSYAYGCTCTLFAHNKCLKNINKCPTCRIEVKKPNLRVYTNLNKNLYFSWIENNISTFKKIVDYIYTISIIILWSNILVIFGYIKLNICAKACILLSLVFLCVVLRTNDFVNKYWLYENR